MKRSDLEWEWKEVIRGLDALQQVEANFQGRRFLFRGKRVRFGLANSTNQAVVNDSLLKSPSRQFRRNFETGVAHSICYFVIVHRAHWSAKKMKELWHALHFSRS
jgi:hypothetical protein